MHSAFAGCGYVGRQVALRELADGGSVSAMVRTVESADRLNEEGIVAVSADLQSQCAPEKFLAGRVLYWFAPPQPESDEDRRLRHFAECAQDAGEWPSRVVLISTTGVYGDCQGDWVMEDRALAPITGRARRRGGRAYAAVAARRGRRGDGARRGRGAARRDNGLLSLSELVGTATGC